MQQEIEITIGTSLDAEINKKEIKELIERVLIPTDLIFKVKSVKEEAEIYQTESKYHPDLIIDMVNDDHYEMFINDEKGEALCLVKGSTADECESKAKLICEKMNS